MYDVLSETENIIFIVCVVIYLTLTAKIIIVDQSYSWLMVSALSSAIFIGGHIGYQKYLMVCNLNSMCSKVRPILDDNICELKYILDKNK